MSKSVPSPTEIIYLSRADVEAAGVPMTGIIERLEAAFREKGHGRVEMPPKPGIHPGTKGSDNFIHAMPALIGALGAAGVKWVSGFPGNLERGLPYISGLLILNDPETGLPRAVMDATWITAMRTGAATAVAVKCLARPGAASFGIHGCGVQGRTNLEAVAAVLPTLRKVRAFDIDPARTARYVDEMRARHPGLEIEAVATPRAAVEGIDVIVTAGPIRVHPQPVLEAAWFGEGALGVPLDYDSYWKTEALRCAARFYTDDTGQILHTRKGGVYFQQIPEVYADLGEVLAGLKDPRRAPRERLVCMNLGIALEDMATAPLVLEAAQRRGLGTRLPL
ncbi:MAG TPA: ornithine cyclodeaminase family protein [Candidatus Polarisedimenticolia bacterium]|nr:ornithine cyclodeaminase family protein [Candidatus Polarisedimenticolia bacterium]